MTVETLSKRIESKKQSIAKLDAKIARIQKAKSTDWKENPYRYSDYDLSAANKERTSEVKALSKYEEALAVELDKATSRNVPALVEFLNDWEQRTIKWYLEEKKRYDNAYPKYKAERDRLTEEFNDRYRLNLSYAQSAELLDKLRILNKEFNEKWNYIMQISYGSFDWESAMRKLVSIEKDRKYDSMIERTQLVVGPIVDASLLRVGQNGEINGIVIGRDGNANVTTIGAGRYNIQKFHFRVLVNRID